MTDFLPLLPLAALVAFGLALGPGPAAAAPPPSPTPPAAAGDAGQALARLLDDVWEQWMRDEPTWASSLGDRRYNDRWAEHTPESFARREARDRSALARLEAIDRAGLTPADRLSYDLFLRRLREDVAEWRFRLHLLPVDQRGGTQSLHELAESLRFETGKDYEDWVARLRALPAVVDQDIALMREGLRAGIVHPRIILDRVPAQVDKLLVDDPAKSPFYKPFRRLSEVVEDPAARTRLEASGRAAIGEAVIPAYRRLKAFLAGEYLPAARSTVGVSALPEGAELYGFLARRYTTTELTPRAIHDLGLSEVARIRGEMEKVKARVGFTGTLEEFMRSLRGDKRFALSDPQALLAAYRAASKKADPELVRLFGRLPRIPYGVKPIPDELAPDTTTAYYQPPAADGSRAGTYYVNLYKPEARPTYEVEALTLHEAVPGHHLQIALAMELGDLPKFRRYTGYTAFVEGWGLYAESLGDEMGMYEDPYAKFGQLTYEMWRAVRLVVDTGIHAFGWERQRAIDYFTANAAKSELDIVNEIDRYIAMPGQALAYKVGELKIKELRRKARAALGERFDVRGFHDVVLGSGAVPLDVLERQVDEWVAGVQAGK